MADLASKTCVPCRSGADPLPPDQVATLITELDGWSAQDSHHLSRTFAFPDFATALAFVNRIGAIAEEQNHHPDIHLTWGKVGVDVWTHKIDGLTESDFVLAAKFDRALDR